jgi:high-affinity iron transporter
MLASILITLREGLEAFLIIAILLGYLKKINQRAFSKYIWVGMSSAILASLILAYVFGLLAIRFSGENSLIFEIVAALFAVGVLTWMVLWMQRQAKTIKADLEHKVDLAISASHIYALAFLAFISVLREGLETVLFLGVLVKQSGPGFVPGAIIGLTIAAVIAYLIFKAAIRFNLRWFFVLTGSLLILIAGGLIAHVTAILQEMQILPVFIKEVWNTNSIINEDGFFGRILHAFIGYNGNPTLIEISAYTSYIVLFSLRFARIIKGNHRNKPGQFQPQTSDVEGAFSMSLSRNV